MTPNAGKGRSSCQQFEALREQCQRAAKALDTGYKMGVRVAWRTSGGLSTGWPWQGNGIPKRRNPGKIGAQLYAKNH
jgi:hypothetical protein